MTPAGQRHPPEPREPLAHEEEHQEAMEALRQVPKLLSELQEYAQHYVAAQGGLLSARFRSVALKAALGALALLAGTAAIATAVILLLVGIAQLLAVGGRAWLGNLIVGGGLLLLVGIGTWLVVRSVRRANIGRTMQAFEARKEVQRRRFHHSAWERSGAVPLRKPEDKAQT